MGEWSNDPVAQVRIRANRRRRAKARNLAGLCYICKQPQLPNHVLCQRHRDDQLNRERERRRARGIQPPKPAASDEERRRADCAKSKRYRERQKQKGLCQWCPRPCAPGVTICEEHRGATRARHRAKKPAPVLVPRKDFVPWDLIEDFEPSPSARAVRKRAEAFTERLRAEHERFLARNRRAQ